MGDVVNIVLFQPSLIHDPWRVGEHLVCPATVPDGLTSLGVGHGGRRLVRSAKCVGTDADEKVNAWEGKFRLA